MSLHIMFSNRLDVLAERLAAGIAAEQPLLGPFASLRVIVPNPNLARWLQFRLAERNGIAANLDFPYLESGMWQLVCDLAPGGSVAPQLLSHGILQQFVAAHLMSGDALAGSPFSVYCRNAAGQFEARDAECIRRTWQISGRLATLFREYEYHREPMLRHWLAGASGSYVEVVEGREVTPSQRDMEAAQRDLYRAIFLPGDGLLTRLSTARPLLTLRGLCERVLGDGPFSPVSAASVSAPTVRLFGLSQLSRFHCDLLHRLAQRYRVELYQFNVCSEFWEDVSTPREDRWRRVRDAALHGSHSGMDEELDLSIENPLLKAWGKAGRETIKLLADLEETYGACVVDWLDEPQTDPAGSAPRSVLRCIQDAVLQRTAAVGRLPQDRSLQIAGCPGIYREIETVHNSIISNLHDPDCGRAAGLRLTDIAVLVPDMATYKPVIASVFDARGAVPYNLVDSNAFQDSVYGRAVLGLLELSGSAFSRRAVFELLFNPCFLAAAGASHADACQWLSWADALGVFHSFDASHRRERGLSATAAFTWSQALQRLRLGRIMSAAPGQAPGGVVFGGIVPHEDMQSDSPVFERFSIVLERLFRRLHPLASAVHSGSEWFAILQALLEDFLAVPEDLPGEEHVRRMLLEAMADFAGIGALPGFDAMLAGAGSPAGVGLPWVREWVASSLAAIPCGKGAYLTGGVTIASLLPMRPIPFEIVYIVGLGEGGFPGRDERSTLDLRHLRRRVGDVGKADAGRYLFLETLSAVRQKLYLTYVQRDLQKDEELFPCSVLKQLLAFTETHILAPGHGGGALPQMQLYRPPLNGFGWGAASASASGGWTDLQREWSLRDWGLKAERAVQRGVLSAEEMSRCIRQARDQAHARHVSTSEGRFLDRLLHEPAPAAEPPREAAAGVSVVSPRLSPDVRVAVSIRQLAAFIRDPAQACMMRHLGIRQQEENQDAALAEDEPFLAGFRSRYQLISGAVEEFARHGGTAHSLDAARAFLEEQYAAGERRSQLPEQLLGELNREYLWKDILQACDGLAEIVQGAVPLSGVVLGQQSVGEVEPGIVYPPLLLPGIELEDGSRVTVELSGMLDLLWPADAQAPARTLLVTTAAQPAQRVVRQALNPFLFFLAAMLQDEPAADGTRLCELVPAAPFSVALRFKPFRKLCCYSGAVAPDVACAYLRGLLRDYLSESRFELLPYDVIGSTRSSAMKALSDALVQGGALPAAGEVAQAITAAVEEELLDEYANVYNPMDILRLNWEKLTVPDDLIGVLQRRYLPLWTWGETGK